MPSQGAVRPLRAKQKRRRVPSIAHIFSVWRARLSLVILIFIYHQPKNDEDEDEEGESLKQRDLWVMLRTSHRPP